MFELVQKIKSEKSYQNSTFRFNWLRLSRTHNVGPITFIELLRLFQTPEKAIERIPELISKGGAKSKIALPAVVKIEQELQSIKRLGARLLLACDAGYPELLLQIPDPPPVLTFLGDTKLINALNSVSIVGARNCSSNGRSFAKNLAKSLGQQGCVIVSGLARGIDAAAHSGALEYGTGAVLAGGIDHVYPPENQALYDLIVQKGYIVSENPTGHPPLLKHFPRRNRIISGLSRAVAVIEAGIKSGTLSTAKFALNQGREVFAVPGSPLDPRCHGTNKLIKDGANLLDCSEDIINLLQQKSDNFCSERKFNSYLTSHDLPTDAELDGYRGKLINSLSHSPTTLEDIIETIEVSPQILSLLILELELAGRLERLDGDKVQLIAIS